MLDTVVISGDDICCSVVLGTLAGVFVFSVMWSLLDVVFCESLGDKNSDSALSCTSLIAWMI